MRAQTVHKRAYIFDLDDTLIQTEARIHIYQNSTHIKSLTPKEFNFYKKLSQDEMDFSDFNDPEMILNSEKYKMWPVLKKVNATIKKNRTTSDIFILTARSSFLKSTIYELLKRDGIDIDINHVLCIGDDEGEMNIAKEKQKILFNLSAKYDEILFFDDNPATIKLAKDIPGIRTRLVEKYINKIKSNR